MVLYEDLDALVAGVEDGSLDINAPDCVGLCPILAALVGGRLPQLEFLLRRQDLDLHPDLCYKDWTILQWAQGSCHQECAKLVVDALSMRE